MFFTKNMERFFTREQKYEHAKEAGWQCEFYIDKYTRCPETGYLEADHIDSFSTGGETDADNLMLLCIYHHMVKHLISDEPWAANLIKKRIDKGWGSKK